MASPSTLSLAHPQHFYARGKEDAAARPNLLFILMGLYVFFLPVQFANAQINLAPSDAFLVLALALGLYQLRFRTEAWGLLHIAMMLIFLLGGAIGTTNAGFITNHIQVKVVGLFVLFAAYLCMSSAAREWDDIQWLLRIFVIATTLHVIVAVGAFAAGISVPWLNYGSERVAGMLLDPNAFGGLVLVALMLQLVTQECGQPLLKGFLGIATIGILSAGLILTFSRSAWIGLVFALAVAAWYRLRLRILACVIAILASAAVWIVLQTRDPNLAIVQRTNTAMQRVEQFELAWPMFTNSPILGTGLGAFAQFNDPETGGPRVIHNSTMWITTELGLVGLTIFLGFLGWFIVRGVTALMFASRRRKPLILGLLCAHAGMYGVSMGIEALYQRHWWMAMALLGACFSIVHREAVQREAVDHRRALAFRA
jgi:putative inorganic carbon (hco3(-)) transporter